jgi:hypothetical protein
LVDHVPYTEARVFNRHALCLLIAQRPGEKLLQHGV